MQRKSFSGDLTYEVRIRDGDYVIAKGCATSGCIHDLYVNEKYRRKGYATQIVKLLMDKYNANWLWCKDDNKEAIALYKKLGFRISKIDDGYYKMSMKEGTK